MLHPPKNPFESLNNWLVSFNKTVAKIVSNRSIGSFHLEPYVGNTFQSVFPTEKNKGDSVGIYTDGEYWLGYYYKIWNNNRVAMPWFGCEFVDKFNISIIIHKDKTADKTNNSELHRYLLLNEFRKRKLWVSQINANETTLLKCCFSDYMRIGYENIRVENPKFNLSDWMCSSTNQDADLKEFFDTINTIYLGPHI